MKIVIPTEEKSISSEICVSFGRTPYFAVYDTETKETVFLDNSAANSSGGAGIKAAQLIAEQKATAVLTAHLGQNAVEVFNDYKISVYRAIPGTVESNIIAFENGEIKLLDEIHPGYHKHN